MLLPKTTTAWTIPATASSITDLTKKSKTIPPLGPKDVLVKITAASLNFRDLLIATRSPAYPGNHLPDLVPGSDGAGIVASAGSSSTWVGREGTPVVLHPSTWLNGDVRNLRADSILGGYGKDGTLQTYLVVNEEQVIAAPKGLTGVESSALFTAGATAWAAIRGGMDGMLDGEIGEYKGAWTDKRLKSKWMLTQGTGGFGTCDYKLITGFKIAAALGANVIVTSSSNAKLEIAKSLGATHLINYTDMPDWDEEVLRMTGGKGVDHVIELGGAKTIMKSLNTARPGGLISVIGILTEAETISGSLVPSVLYGSKIVKGCMGFSRDMSAEYVRFVEANGIKPVIAKIFGFENIIEGFEALQKQNAVGKLVVNISNE
ncbi:NAD(P)-binding protein [Lojkania enalia]|uniref:NAD(P)-binding protein n=1 Tax=Lojkania enalia TaxID=147567 RepID=A0A9P4K1N8_9PLEO|nr:NAD(P)-binding protein [Didymosphaeria enalia]